MIDLKSLGEGDLLVIRKEPPVHATRFISDPPATAQEHASEASTRVPRARLGKLLSVFTRRKP